VGGEGRGSGKQGAKISKSNRRDKNEKPEKIVHSKPGGSKKKKKREQEKMVIRKSSRN